MRRCLLGMAVILSMAVTAAIPGTAARADAEVARVAIVDVQHLLSQAAAMKGVEAQIKEIQKGFQSEITEQEQELRAKDEELQNQRGVLSPEVLANRERDLEEQFLAIRQLAESRNRQLTSAKINAVNKFNEALVDVVTAIAKDEGYDMVLAKAQVVYVADAFDITEKALERINERVPSLKVELPAN